MAPQKGAFFMKKKLWQKNNWELDKFVEYFETKDDLTIDQGLLFYDLLGSLAHAKMLKKISILTAEELVQIETGLKEIGELAEQGRFELEFGDEDIHSKIENYLTSKFGEVGQKIHTGRSRNDQVLTAIRLFTKHKLIEIWQEAIQLCSDFSEFSKKYERVLMPGFTHMQKAMPTTVGMWSSAFSVSLTDDLDILKTSYLVNDQNPLGSGTGLGMPLNLDRELTTKLLGFSKVQTPSMYVQNSRGKIEANVVSSLVSVLQTANKFSSDVMLFTTSEFNYFNVDPSVCSGSSAMPQKKNVDLAELIRSKLHLVIGNYVQITSLSANLISGYNRDLQDTKKPLFESLETCLETIQATRILLSALTPNIENLEKKMTKDLFATHAAYKQVANGVPFRKAYQNVASNLDHVEVDLTDVFELSKHTGGIGNLGLKQIETLIKDSKLNLKSEQSKFNKSMQVFFKDEESIQPRRVGSGLRKPKLSFERA